MDLQMDALIELYREGVDAMINQINNTPCKIFYPPSKTECPNCTLVTLFDSSSNNIYKAGGPAPFSTGLCPVCSGAGFREVFYSEEVIFRCYFNKKDWRKFGSSIVLETSDCMVLGDIVHMPKLVQCSHIQVNTNLTDSNDYKYKLNGEPYKHGFGNYYFCAFFKRST